MEVITHHRNPVDSNHWITERELAEHLERLPNDNGQIAVWMKWADGSSPTAQLFLISPTLSRAINATVPEEAYLGKWLLAKADAAGWQDLPVPSDAAENQAYAMLFQIADCRLVVSSPK
jgi:hypothetical protein